MATERRSKPVKPATDEKCRLCRHERRSHEYASPSQGGGWRGKWACAKCRCAYSGPFKRARS